MSKEAIAQAAIQMVIFDAIENSHTDPKELALYMQSETFKAAYKGYYEMIEKEFRSK